MLLVMVVTLAWKAILRVISFHLLLPGRIAHSLNIQIFVHSISILQMRQFAKLADISEVNMLVICQGIYAHI